MQNKPNFRKAKMNVTSFYTVDYENKSNWKLGQNKPNQSQYKANTNPILSAIALAKAEQTQFPKCPNRCKLSKNKEL